MDGDGTLDLVFVLDLVSAVKDAKSMDFIRMKTDSSIMKINLEQRVGSAATNNAFIPIQTFVAKDIQKSSKEKSFSEMKLRPYKEQLWTKYLGKYSDSVYSEIRNQ